MSNYEFKQVFAEAQKAAEDAYAKSVPTPVAWQNSGLTEGFDWSKPYQIEPGGVCGFAWVNISVDGRSSEAKTLKEFGAHKNYYPGSFTFWSSDCAPSSRATQSLERQEAACKAFADVLQKYGWSAYMQSRLD